MKNNSTDSFAKIIWDYHHLHHQLEKADCIFILGSHDTRVAEYGAKLFNDGWAPFVIFAGTGIVHRQNGDLLQTAWKKSEAEIFADIAISRGVPQEKILIENQSTNTGENIMFTRKLIAEKHLNLNSFLLVQKPYMERRASATFKKIWPEKQLIVTSPPISFENYPNKDISKEDVINIMVGDLQRIKLYPALGFQIEQSIPPKVWDAYKKLIALGYTKHLMSDTLSP